MNKRYEFIDDDLNKWHCKIDDDFKPSRNQFIIDRFERDYGSVQKIDTINELVSRSLALKEWYSKVIEEYILEVDVPQYFIDKIDPKQYKKLSQKVSEFNSILAQESEAKRNLSLKYKADLENINLKFEPKKNEIVKDNFVRVLTLTKEELPLKLQLLLVNYSPNEESDPRTASLYGREMLVRYKIELLDHISKGDDIEKIIQENQSKF